jgi:hypothetical protein
VFSYRTGNGLFPEAETPLINREPSDIALASSMVSVVASLSSLVRDPNVLTMPLLTMRRFFPKLAASFSVFIVREAERFDTTIRENVPRKTPRIARAVRTLKFRRERIAILRFRMTRFIPIFFDSLYPLIASIGFRLAALFAG